MYLIDSTGKIYFLREKMSYQLVTCLEVVLLWLQFNKTNTKISIQCLTLICISHSFKLNNKTIEI